MFGVSGVCKTTLISEITRREPAWQRASAGSFIEQYRPEVGHDSLRMLSTDAIRDNQEAIVRGLAALRTLIPFSLLADGHVLIDSGREFVEISLDVIRRLALDAVVFISDAPEQIAQRRQADTDRNRAERSYDDIDQEQSHACEIAERYARELGIPFATALPSQRKRITSLVRKWLRS